MIDRLKPRQFLRVRTKLPRDSFVLDVDLELPAQGVTAIYGPSGCGKTSLLRAVAGLEKNAVGEVGSESFVWQTYDRCVPTHKRSIGFVFQEPSLFEYLTVRGNLEFGVDGHQPQELSFSFERVAELLDLQKFLDRRPSHLSGGEKQRVAIGRSLLRQPSVLLLDEPLSALDREIKSEILPFLEKLSRQFSIPILYVSHDIKEVARLADHIVVMREGRVVKQGPVNEIFSSLDSELATASDGGSVIVGEVTEIDQDYGLAQVCFDEHHFWVNSKNLLKGSEVRIQILSRDVSLTLDRQQGTSILNIFQASICEINHVTSSQVLLKTLVGKTHILARITKKSFDALSLGKGTDVFIQVKSVAVLNE